MEKQAKWVVLAPVQPIRPNFPYPVRHPTSPLGIYGSESKALSLLPHPPHVDKTRKRWRGSFPLSKQPSSPKTSLGDTSFSLGARTAAYFWLNSVGGYLLPSAPTRAISRYISAPKCKVVASDSVGRSDIRHRLRCGVGGGVSIALAPFFSLLACLLFQFFSLEPRWRGK